MTESPLLVLTARHSPFELSTAVIAFLTGLVTLLGVRESPALEAVGNAIPYYLPIWSIGLMISGAVILTGAPMRLPESLIVERIGLSLLATLCTSYVIGIFFVHRFGAIGTTLFVASFAIGSVARIVRINRDIRLIEAAGT